VFIAWPSNWQYSEIIPTGSLEGWRSSMSLPRQTTLANVTRIGYDLVLTLYNLSSVYSYRTVSENLTQSESLFRNYSTVTSGALYFKVNVSSIPSSGTAQGTLNFTFSASSTSESVFGGYFFFWRHAFLAQ
jgi:beta-fructofuranosidase